MPTPEQRRLAMIDNKDYDEWFQQFWNITGASTREHPALFRLNCLIGSSACSHSWEIQS